LPNPGHGWRLVNYSHQLPIYSNKVFDRRKVSNFLMRGSRWRLLRNAVCVVKEVRARENPNRVRDGILTFGRRISSLATCQQFCMSFPIQRHGCAICHVSLPAAPPRTHQIPAGRCRQGSTDSLSSLMDIGKRCAATQGLSARRDSRGGQSARCRLPAHVGSQGRKIQGQAAETTSPKLMRQRFATAPKATPWASRRRCKTW
jgi:hypothetical protein